MAALKITDHGTGIEKEVLDNLFDPFYTTKAEGSGDRAYNKSEDY